MTIELPDELAARIRIAAINADQTPEEFISAAVEARLINDRNSLRNSLPDEMRRTREFLRLFD